MKIEVLYSEVANLYGDLFNIKYLEQTFPDLTVYYTGLNDRPRFADEKIDLIYMGPMMERFQEVVIEKLMPYKDKIKELIENDVVFLITGNALEIFGKKIDDTEALGIFETTARRNFAKHHNSCFIGKFDGMYMVGYKSQFGSSYNNSHPFISVVNGYGLNSDDKSEGIRYRNFFGTYLIGPLLVYNPPFTEYLLGILGQNVEIAHRDSVYEAYKLRTEEYLSYKLPFRC